MSISESLSFSANSTKMVSQVPRQETTNSGCRILNAIKNQSPSHASKDLVKTDPVILSAIALPPALKDNLGQPDLSLSSTTREGLKIEGSKTLPIKEMLSLSSVATSVILDNPIMDAWLKDYGHDYVAHAIFEEPEITLEAGRVMPKEMIFRLKRRVRYEAFAHERALVDVRDFSQEILEKIKNLPSNITWEHPHKDYPFNWKEYVQKIDQEMSSLIKKAAATRMPLRELSKQRQPLSKNREIPQAGAIRSFKEEEALVFGAKGYLRDYHIRVLRDELQEKNNRIDTILLQHYKNLIESGVPHSEAHKKCIAIRDMELGISKLDPEIRTGKNCIWWNYGDIVVLRGGGSAITASLGKSEAEALLIAPFQNNGEFFCLDLNRDDTIILGPKKLLEKYKEKYGNRIVYIEELSDKQKQVLKVPERLINLSQ